MKKNLGFIDFLLLALVGLVTFWWPGFLVLLGLLWLAQFLILKTLNPTGYFRSLLGLVFRGREGR